MRDGTKIEVAKMEDSHLVNCIYYFYNRRVQYLLNMLASMENYMGDAPEMAADSLEGACEELYESDPDLDWLDYLSPERRDQLVHVIQEIWKRKLQTKLDNSLLESLKYQGLAI